MQQIVAGGDVYQASTVGRGIQAGPRRAAGRVTATAAGEAPPDAGERPVRAGGVP